MRADAHPARLCELDRLPHDVGIAGMKAAGDVDRGGKLDHGGVIAHLPGAETFAEIAVEIDAHEGVSGCVKESWSSADSWICQVRTSKALTAWPATLALCSASMSSIDA